jgi:hypothetical protein
MHAEFRDRNSIGQITLSENITGLLPCPLSFPDNRATLEFESKNRSVRGGGPLLSSYS